MRRVITGWMVVMVVLSSFASAYTTDQVKKVLLKKGYNAVQFNAALTLEELITKIGEDNLGTPIK